MKALMRNMIISALLLGLFAVAGTAIVSLTFDLTRDTIADMEREYLLNSLHIILAENEHDNDLFSDTRQLLAPQQLGSKKPITVYRARKAGKPVAAVFSSVAPDGYNGDIHLLVGVYADGSLAGVRVLKHLETPGLGDRIEADRSDWILGFDGLTLRHPDNKGWAVKKDGGSFDQFTGATITPRAVVKAVHKTLLYFQQNRQMIFAPTEQPITQEQVHG